MRRKTETINYIDITFIFISPDLQRMNEHLFVRVHSGVDEAEC
jgi:hypothetical protein